MATNEAYIPGQLYTISLNNLPPDPEQPRKYMDTAALTEMVESIKEHGIIQPPTFRVGEGGLLTIVTGGKTTAAHGTFNAMGAVERKINNLDFQTLSSEYRDSFVIALENLKQTVQNKLDTTPQTGNHAT